MSRLNRDTKGRRYIREMTVAQIRDSNADYVEVVFLESARFFRLPKGIPSFRAYLDLLKTAVEGGGVLRIAFASPDSDIIENVSKPATPE